MEHEKIADLKNNNLEFERALVIALLIDKAIKLKRTIFELEYYEDYHHNMGGGVDVILEIPYLNSKTKIPYSNIQVKYAILAAREATKIELYNLEQEIKKLI